MNVDILILISEHPQGDPAWSSDETGLGYIIEHKI